MVLNPAVLITNHVAMSIVAFLNGVFFLLPQFVSTTGSKLICRFSVLTLISIRPWPGTDTLMRSAACASGGQSEYFSSLWTATQNSLSLFFAIFLLASNMAATRRFYVSGRAYMGRHPDQRVSARRYVIPAVLWYLALYGGLAVAIASTSARMPWPGPLPLPTVIIDFCVAAVLPLSLAALPVPLIYLLLKTAHPTM